MKCSNVKYFKNAVCPIKKLWALFSPHIDNRMVDAHHSFIFPCRHTAVSAICWITGCIVTGDVLLLGSVKHFTPHSDTIRPTMFFTGTLYCIMLHRLGAYHCTINCYETDKAKNGNLFLNVWTIKMYLLLYIQGYRCTSG